MVRSAAAVAFDGRERSDVKTASRRRRARRKATSTSTATTSTSTPTVFYSVIRTHARNMSKVAAVLQKKKLFGFSVCGGNGKEGRNARSIFDWSLVGVGLGIRLGCVRCRRRSNIVWRRRSAVRDRSRIRGLVCGSCSIAVLVTYSSRQYGRLVVRGEEYSKRRGVSE
jgi:hypothetical protein